MQYVRTLSVKTLSNKTDLEVITMLDPGSSINKKLFDLYSTTFLCNIKICYNRMYSNFKPP